MKRIHTGQSIFEILIAVGIFTIGVVGILSLGVDAGTLAQSGGDRVKATYLAKEGIEAVRSLKDYSFDELVDGEHGIAIENGVWVFSGTSDTQDDFTRVVTIEPTDDAFTKHVEVAVSWPGQGSQNHTVNFETYLSNWSREELTEIECFNADVSGASIEQGSAHKIIRYIWISNPSCGRDINLDKIIVEYDLPGNNIFKVRIDNYFKWQGNAPSGTVLDLEPNETLTSGAPAKEIDQLRWYQEILGSDIQVTFIMADGSLESFTIPAFY